MPRPTCGDRLYKLAKKYCHTAGKPDLARTPHLSLCDDVARQYDHLKRPTEKIRRRAGRTTLPGRNRFVDEEPRGNYKTSIITKCSPIDLLIDNPNARILISSHTVIQARKFLAAISGILSSAAFVAEYGDWYTGARKWAADAITINRRTAHHLTEPSVDTCGVDKPVTGGHYDYIILDDLHSEANAFTYEGRRTVREHIELMWPVLEPNGALVVACTRWHHADAYGRLKKEDDERERDGKMPLFEYRIRGCYNDDGSLYSPNVITQEVIDEQRAGLTDKMFACFMLNRPIDDKSVVFHPDFGRFFKGRLEYNNGRPFIEGTVYGGITASGDKRPSIEVRVPVSSTIAIDPAVTDNKGSANSGFTHVACDDQDNWYLLDAYEARELPDALCDRMVGWCARIRPRVISIEAVAAQVLFRPLVAPRLREAGLTTTIHMFYPGNKYSKLARIERMQPRWKAGKFIISDDCRFVFDQMIEYPELDYFDLLDSAAQHIDIAKPPRAPEPVPVYVDADSELDEDEQAQGAKDPLDGTWVGSGSAKRLSRGA